MGIPICLPFPQIIGIFVGISSLRKIRNSGGALKGRGLAIAGLIVCSFWVIALATGAYLLLSGRLDGPIRDALNDRAPEITREEFIERNNKDVTSDPVIMQRFNTPALQLGLVHAVSGFASCSYDIWALEPALLAEVYKDPNADEYQVPFRFDELAEELNESVQLDCLPKLEAEVEALVGGG